MSLGGGLYIAHPAEICLCAESLLIAYKVYNKLCVKIDLSVGFGSEFSSHTPSFNLCFQPLPSSLAFSYFLAFVFMDYAFFGLLLPHLSAVLGFE